jgi:hypothetical protein
VVTVATHGTQRDAAVRTSVSASQVAAGVGGATGYTVVEPGQGIGGLALATRVPPVLPAGGALPFTQGARRRRDDHRQRERGRAVSRSAGCTLAGQMARHPPLPRVIAAVRHVAVARGIRR